MEERLSVRIEADIKNFQQGMSQVENNLKRAEGIFQSSSRSAFQLENAIAQLSREFKEGAVSRNQYNAQLAHLNAELTKQRTNVSASAREMDRLNKLMSAKQMQKVATANTAAAKSFQGLATNVRGSNTVAMEFNRIIQDAPFGMMGIGNNVQQLAGNFSQLSKNAGGTVPAIKAAFSAMVTGPNLALLAISALTAGITAYNMGAFDFLKSNKEAEKSLEELREESEEYVKNLNAIQRAQVVGAQSAQAQLTSLRLLYERTQDVTLSEEERLKAISELQRVYPQAFGNINQEIILNGQAKKSYDDLATSILATAKARAAEDTLVDQEKQLIALNKERDKVLQDINKQEAEAERYRTAKNPVQTNPEFKSANEYFSDAALDQADALYPRYAELNKMVNELEASNRKLADGIRQSQSEIVIDLGKTGDEFDDLNDDIQSIVDHAGDLNFKELANIQESFGLDEGKLEKDFANLIKTVQEKVAASDDAFVNVPVKLDFTPETLGADAQAQNDAIVEQWKERMKTIEQFGGQLQNTLAGAFEQSMLTGDDFFKSFADGFKKMLAQMAAQLAASAVIKFLGFIVGGPAGGALAAGGGGSMLGSLFGGAAMRIGQTPAIGSPTGGSSTAGYRVDVNVHGVLRGNDIHVAQQRNNRDFDRYY